MEPNKTIEPNPSPRPENNLNPIPAESAQLSSQPQPVQAPLQSSGQQPPNFTDAEPTQNPPAQQFTSGDPITNINYNSQASTIPEASPTEPSQLHVAPVQQAPPPIGAPPQETVVFSAEPTGLLLQNSKVPNQKNPKKHLAIILGSSLSLLVLLAGSAFAYMQIVASQDPETRLAKSIANLMSQDNVSFKATAEANTDSVPVNLSFDAGYNVSGMSFESAMSVGVSGMRFPVNIKFVDKNFYFMLDDTKAITDILASYLQSEDGSESSLESLDGKWFVLDKSAFDSNKELSECMDSAQALTASEYQFIANGYRENPFLVVESSSKVEKDGKSLLKIKLGDINKDQYDALIAELKTNKEIEKVIKCGDNGAKEIADDVKDAEQTVSDITNSANGDLYFYLDSDNQIVSIEGNSEEDGNKLTYKFDFDYNKQVQVKAPDNPEPIQNLVNYFYNFDEAN